MSNFSQTIEQKVMPVMGKISSNKAIMAITGGMMATMPLTLGTCLVAIAANFPVAAWTSWLASAGIAPHMAAVISGTTELMGLYVVFAIAFNYGKLKGHDGMTAGVLSLGAFLVLMPQKIKLADGSMLDAFTKNYLGSSGIFVAMILAIFIASIYCALDKRGLVIKLPDSVPEMVAKSLSPTFIAIIIFVVVLLIRVAFGATSYGNIFDFVNGTVGKPIMNFGASPSSIIFVFVICNIFWCFGIHPNTIFSVYMPVFLAVSTANIGAFQAGTVLPYLSFAAVAGYLMVGGTGCTLGLAIDMVLFSKSERFKALGKLAIVPSFFNINEPLIFGTPIIFNPVFFIPMFSSAIVNGGIGYLFYKIGAYATMNPTIALPWIMPAPISQLLGTGILACVGVCCAIAATAVLYFPFFKYADKQALKEEQGELQSAANSSSM
ncbi:MAG: PTS sugar transporter subunit IIC [Clostridiaceae bacterium]